MRKTNITFEPGDILSAAKHNGLVADAEEPAAGLDAEHAGGRHVDLRFEQAWGMVEWDPAPLVHAWVSLVEDRIQVVDWLQDRGWLRAFIQRAELPVLSAESLGVIAHDDWGRIVPVSDIRYSGASDQVIIVEMHPYSSGAQLSNRVSVVVFGEIDAS